MAKKRKVVAKVHKKALESKLARVRRTMARNAEEAASALEKVSEVLAKNQATEQGLVEELAKEIEVLPPVIAVEETPPNQIR